MSTDEDRLAELCERLGLPHLSAEEVTAVLDLTRVVAHGVERRFGPLTAYALGLAMSTRTDAPERAARVRRAAEQVEG